MSNHGHVLVALSKDPHARMREIAQSVGVTERAVQQIVRDLVRDGYVDKTKVGRRNSYTVHRTSTFRHDLEKDVSVGAFLELVGKTSR